MRVFRKLKRTVRTATAAGPGVLAGKVLRALRRGGVKALITILRNVWGGAESRPVAGMPHASRDDYPLWVRTHDTLTPVRKFELEIAASRLPRQPLISVIMPTYNTSAEWLVEAVESIRGQFYSNWELCVADDASTAPHVQDMLQAYAALDPRIRVVLRHENGHICATTNSALDLARGEWMALLDHDDVLPADALFWVAKAINEHPDAQMIYSDEDKLDEAGQRFGPYFKPDWNPDLILSQNMFSHLGVFRTDLVRAVGGFRPGFEGSQDYDLTLRCAERVSREQIVHIPRVLYHWRVHAGSTARSHEAKPYAISAGHRALQEHLSRRGRVAQCEQTHAGFRIRYALGVASPRVALLVIARPGEEVAAMACARDAIAETDYSRLLVYVISGDRKLAPSGEVRVLCGSSERERIQAAMEAIANERVDVVCLLDAALQPRSRDWLTEMVSQAMREEVGAVGAKILSDLQIESTGIVLLPGDPPRPADAHHGAPVESLGYLGRAQLTHQCTAVRSACMVLRADVFLRLGTDWALAGYDSGLEISRRVRELALDIVCTPHAELTAEEDLLPLPAHAEWPGMERGDPAYNPNLHGDTADFSLAWPPRHAPVLAGE